MNNNQLHTFNKHYTFPFFTTSNYFNLFCDQWADKKKLHLKKYNQESTLLKKLHLDSPQVVIFGAEQSVITSGVISRLAATMDRPKLVAVVKTRNENQITECYEQGADRVVAIPDCSAKIFFALLNTLVRKEHYYPPYRLSTAIQTINYEDIEVRLTKKRFDVAQYLFVNHGKIISKATILQDLWGLDSQQCFTSRIEVHISHIRRLLTLDGSHGWEIRARRKIGYGIFHNADILWPMADGKQPQNYSR